MNWSEVSRTDLGKWNRRLLSVSAASVRQYPFLNEGHRVSGHTWINFPRRYAALIERGRRWITTPHYLVHQSSDGKTTYACIVSIGVPGFRFGCIPDGLVALDGGPIEPSVVQSLLTWARHNGYVALRLTHPDAAYLDSLAALGNTDRKDSVPFYPYPPSELYVDLSADEATLLASFKPIARREIRQASEAGYDITIDHAPVALEKAWPAFQARAAQKGINYRSLRMWELIMREAEPHQAAQLHTAWRNGVPIAAILIIRDYTTAHYFLGSTNTDALGDAPSPACLLQWSAMGQAKNMGCTVYNLGTRSGPVYQFKTKFRPVEHYWPSPLTFSIRPRLYQMWCRLLPSIGRVVA